MSRHTFCTCSVASCCVNIQELSLTPWKHVFHSFQLHFCETFRSYKLFWCEMSWINVLLKVHQTLLIHFLNECCFTSWGIKVQTVSVHPTEGQISFFCLSIHWLIIDWLFPEAQLNMFISQQTSLTAVKFMLLYCSLLLIINNLSTFLAEASCV